MNSFFLEHKNRIISTASTISVSQIMTRRANRHTTRKLNTIISRLAIISTKTIFTRVVRQRKIFIRCTRCKMTEKIKSIDCAKQERFFLNLFCYEYLVPNNPISTNLEQDVQSQHVPDMCCAHLPSGQLGMLHIISAHSSTYARFTGIVWHNVKFTRAANCQENPFFDNFRIFHQNLKGDL